MIGVRRCSYSDAVLFENLLRHHENFADQDIGRALPTDIKKGIYTYCFQTNPSQKMGGDANSYEVTLRIDRNICLFDTILNKLFIASMSKPMDVFYQDNTLHLKANTLNQMTVFLPGDPIKQISCSVLVLKHEYVLRGDSLEDLQSIVKHCKDKAHTDEVCSLSQAMAIVAVITTILYLLYCSQQPTGFFLYDKRTIGRGWIVFVWKHSKCRFPKNINVFLSISQRRRGHPLRSPSTCMDVGTTTWHMVFTAAGRPVFSG